MRRLPKIFAHRRDPGAGSSFDSSSSSKNLAGKPKRRLERLNAKKNIDYEFSPSSTSVCSASSYCDSEESLRTRSVELYEGKSSFRIDGFDGEFEFICERLGFSGIDDFAIPAEEYEAMKVSPSSSNSPPVVFSETIEHLIDGKLNVSFDEAVELTPDSGGAGAVDAVCREIEGNDAYVGLAENRGGITSMSCKEGCDFGSMDRIMDGAGTSDVMLSNDVSGRLNELRGSGIKGVRPPVLAPPPLMSLPVIDKGCSTWDIFRSFAPDGDASVECGFCFDEEGDQKRSEYDGHEEYRRRRALGRQDSYVLSGSCSFNTTSNDDDSSSTTTDPTPSISPTGRFNRVISGWQKGELLGRGSFGSVYEGIADDGFFFAVKEVSLLDRGDDGKQRCIQLEQEIALLSQFEHENIVQYYGTKKDELHLYIFLEYVTKGSLLSLYQKYVLWDSQVSAYTRQILHGLKYLHDRTVMHRDIKCANILVSANGLVKLADFGLAKATKLNDVNSCKGTAFWMAPEVVRSHRYGLAADIWSLGCTVLEMLTRRFPYSDMECMAALFMIGNGERPPIPDNLSSDARDFILKCLQVDPSLRPTAAQLLNHPFVKRPLPSSSGFPSPRHFTQPS